jgi:hypothetical protein
MNKWLVLRIINSSLLLICLLLLFFQCRNRSVCRGVEDENLNEFIALLSNIDNYEYFHNTFSCCRLLKTDSVLYFISLNSVEYDTSNYMLIIKKDRIEISRSHKIKPESFCSTGNSILCLSKKSGIGINPIDSTISNSIENTITNSIESTFEVLYSDSIFDYVLWQARPLPSDTVSKYYYYRDKNLTKNNIEHFHYVKTIFCDTKIIFENLYWDPQNSYSDTPALRDMH